MRGRVQFNATVNDKTDAVVRVSSGDVEFGDSADYDAVIDRAYVNHKFSDKASLAVGRMGLVVGNGLFYDDDFDGAIVKAGNDKVKFEAGYGYLLQGEYFGKVADEQDEKAEFAYASVKTNVGDKATIGGFYGKFSGEGVGIGNNKYEDVYGFNVDANFNKVWIGGEWLDMNDVDDASAWVAGIGYGDYKISKAGSWDVKARYIDQDTNSFLPKTTFVQPTRNYSYTSNSKGWIASVDYALQKNVGLSAYYGFSWETQKGADLGDFYRAELNYKF